MFQEWPLITYTLVGQAAAGLFLSAAVLRECIAPKLGDAEARQITRRPQLVAGVLLAVATLFSMLHLGSPLGAFRAMNNLGTSWLSREILMTGLFGVLWLAGLRADNRYLRWLTAVSGLGMVFAMGMLYQSSIIPAWQTPFTLVSFVTTALVAGGVLLLMLVPKEIGQGAVVGSLTALTGVAVQLVALPLYLASLGAGSAPARASVAAMTGPMAPWLVAHVVLMAVAAAVLGMVLSRKAAAPRLVSLALAAGLAGAAAARVLFYAAGFPIQVG